MSRFEATVSAIPADGHQYRYRAGPAGKRLPWGKTPRVVIVDETPDYSAEPIVISPADWAALVGDPQIKAIARGSAEDAAVAAAKGEAAKLAAALDVVRANLAAEQEARAEEQRAATAREQDLHDKIRSLTNQIDEMRGKRRG